MLSSFVESFTPELWDPFIDAVTSILGPFPQFFAPLSAVTSSALGLF
ncbi:hypothetical protein [Corynebacterium senegalense]|nr:hypothetical protein [Corynebacterium senegalense]